MTTLEEMKRLAEKYMIRGTVGDQDWLTVLGWEMEDMFYILPCQFNVQMDQVYNTEKVRLSSRLELLLCPLTVSLKFLSAPSTLNASYSAV